MQLLLSLLAAAIESKGGKISTHAYPDQKKILDTNPVSCGYKGEDMNVHRITAQSGINSYPCGTCVRIKAKGKEVDVVVVDKGGVNFDLSTTAFNTLFGEKTGIHEATWDQVDKSNCEGVIKTGGHKGDSKPDSGENKKDEGGNKKEGGNNKKEENSNNNEGTNNKKGEANKNQSTSNKKEGTNNQDGGNKKDNKESKSDNKKGAYPVNYPVDYPVQAPQ